MKVALTYNLKPLSVEGTARLGPDDAYAEWDDPATITAVRKALAVEHDVVLVEGRAEMQDLLSVTRPDMVFNLAEGWGGAEREAVIPTLLQHRGVPFTGSSAHTLRLCLDKAATKRLLRQHGLPTPDYMIVARPEAVRQVTTFPLIVKPLHEGSSKGIYGASVVYDRCALQTQVERIVQTYEQPALVEAFLPGREFTVALLGTGAQVAVLPLVEICFAALPSGALPIYSYEAKWLWDSAEHALDILHCPADLDSVLADNIRDVCRWTFRVLGCRDWCRIDLRLGADGRPYILEANPLPGVLPDPDSHSGFPTAAAAAGIAYPDLIRSIVRLACGRYAMPTA